MTSTTSWADIQQLAADLKRVQLAESNKQRLTESNCVEVVKMLISMGLIELVISTDGKEYVTRKYLQTECANECLAAGGRILLTDLATQLNVDLDHISRAVNQLVRQSNQDEVNILSEFIICAGELIHRDFIINICTKLNEQLEELGTLSILQLIRQWELPTELLHQHILAELGTGRLSAIRFDDYLCTSRYINTLRGKMKAIFIVLTKPCPLNEIYTYLDVNESFFFFLLNELNDQGRLPGKILGSKNSIKSYYIPYIHERMAEKFVLQRLSEENFIECNIMKRLGISVDPNVFFRELLPLNEFNDLIFFPSVVLSNSLLWTECNLLATNLLNSKYFCIIENILPTNLISILNESDYTKIFEILQKGWNKGHLRTTNDNQVIFDHSQLILSWLKIIEEFIHEKAIKDAPELRKAQLNSAISIQKQLNKEEKGHQKDDDWEIEKTSKGGKGTRKGRSGISSSNRIKQKSLAVENISQKDLLSTVSPFKLDELFNELERCLDLQIPYALREEIADDFISEVNNLYRNVVKEEWEKQFHQTTLEEQQAHRQAFEQNLTKIAEEYIAICLFEKGADSFTNDKLSNDLKIYLLRSLCTELSYSLLYALLDPNLLKQQSFPLTNVNTKQRDLLINSLESMEMQKCSRHLFDSLDTLEHFHEAFQRLTAISGLILKQPDKKERALRLSLFGAELLKQMMECIDPPKTLLLAVLLCLQRYHKMIVHASGKFVSSLIQFLSNENSELSSNLIILLNETQHLVVENIKHKGDSEKIQNDLNNKLIQLKEFLFNSIEIEKEENNEI
ncbi:hypothetical protein Mgra_00005321 [Meloidogyne graminicola]|uniref:E3 UFM1-protein ligase 1 homolog n=1 Tax=Meloidogyne graminicola TaxID=189291 RepID=A0A8S9ZQ66_9BILA|nr:hypothetical protein Mgra_00005321 [Meloidogyne graminicola]